MALPGRPALLTAPVRLPCTVLIAQQDALPALVERAATIGGELLAFSERDVLRALETIITRRPSVVALAQRFAASARGAALIGRIAADPALAESTIRVYSVDTMPDAPAPTAAMTPAVGATVLDEHGTRRARRVAMVGVVEILLDGNPATLVNLSTLGAQVTSSTVLRPNQRVRIAIADGELTIRPQGTIVWASFEMPPGGGPMYRAGLAFVGPDTAALEAFCSAHLAEAGRSASSA